MTEKINNFRSSTFMYDIFGYFLPGFFFLCLFIIDFDLGTILKYYFDHGHSLKEIQTSNISYKFTYLFNFLTWNTESDFKFTTLLILISFCYLMGHVIAAISSQVLEIWINNGILKFPSENLLKEGKRNWIQKRFKNYTKPFDVSFISLFKEKFRDRFGDVKEKHAYFWLCFGEIAKRHPAAYNRILHFLSLYGFSRNISACFFIYSISRTILSFCTHLIASKFNWGIVIVFFLIGAMMFKNYLKLFYRQCVELYYHFYCLQTDTRKIE